jgi:transcriptional regulator with XRE-family HTH domain
MIISDRIFELLKQKGITQKELSEKTGIPQSTISDWKGKRVNPAADKIMILCEALDVSPYELLSGTENDKCTPLDYCVIRKNTEEYVMLEQFRQMESDQKARLLGYMEAIRHLQK